jgi:hypothetical protein
VTDLMSTTDNVLSFISIGLGILLGLLLLPLSRGLPAVPSSKVESSND